MVLVCCREVGSWFVICGVIVVCCCKWIVCSRMFDSSGPPPAILTSLINAQSSLLSSVNASSSRSVPLFGCHRPKKASLYGGNEVGEEIVVASVRADGRRRQSLFPIFCVSAANCSPSCSNCFFVGVLSMLSLRFSMLAISLPCYHCGFCPLTPCAESRVILTALCGLHTSFGFVFFLVYWG